MCDSWEPRAEVSSLMLGPALPNWKYSYQINTLRPDFTSYLVHGIAFRTSKFYIAPYGKINHRLVNLSSNCDAKSGLSAIIVIFISNDSFRYALMHLF